MALGPGGKGRDCKSQARKYSVQLREAPPKIKGKQNDMLDTKR